MAYQSSSKIEPVSFILDNEVEDGTDDTLPGNIYKDSMDTVKHVSDIIYHNILISKKILLPQVEDSEVIHAQVKARDAQFDPEKDMLLVSLVEGQDTDIMTYDAIIKRLDMKLQRDPELGDMRQLFLLRYIFDHQTIKGNTCHSGTCISDEM